MQIDDELTLKKLQTFLVFMRAGNLSRAAQRLGISRVTLHDKLNKHGIGKDDPDAE